MSGDEYDGIWHRGRPLGQMKVSMANGDMYEGMMDTTYHGTGRMEYGRNLGSYEGQWSKGKPHGKGKLIL